MATTDELIGRYRRGGGDQMMWVGGGYTVRCYRSCRKLPTDELSSSCCQVVAVGGGRKKEDSEEWITPNVTVGQTVMYSKYSGTEFEVRYSVLDGGMGDMRHGEKACRLTLWQDGPQVGAVSHEYFRD